MYSGSKQQTLEINKNAAKNHIIYDSLSRVCHFPLNVLTSPLVSQEPAKTTSWLSRPFFLNRCCVFTVFLYAVPVVADEDLPQPLRKGPQVINSVEDWLTSVHVLLLQITQLKIDNNPFAKGFRDSIDRYESIFSWRWCLAPPGSFPLLFLFSLMLAPFHCVEIVHRNVCIYIQHVLRALCGAVQFSVAFGKTTSVMDLKRQTSC